MDRTPGVIFDQTESFRGIRDKDPETGKRLRFITHNTALPALKISALYKARLQVELFFRWIKQHLRISPSLPPPRTR